MTVMSAPRLYQRIVGIMYVRVRVIFHRCEGGISIFFHGVHVCIDGTVQKVFLMFVN